MTYFSPYQVETVAVSILFHMAAPLNSFSIACSVPYFLLNDKSKEPNVPQQWQSCALSLWCSMVAAHST